MKKRNPATSVPWSNVTIELDCDSLKLALVHVANLALGDVISCDNALGTKPVVHKAIFISLKSIEMAQN